VKNGSYFFQGLESFYSLSSNQITCKSHQGQGHDENFVEHRDDRLSCLYSPVSDSGRSIWSDQTKYQLGGWERESRLNLLATLADLRWGIQRSFSQNAERSWNQVLRLRVQSPAMTAIFQTWIAKKLQGTLSQGNSNMQWPKHNAIKVLITR